MDQYNFQQKLDQHVKTDMMQVLATSSPLKLQDAKEDNHFKKLANKLNGVLIKMESHAIALRNTLNTYEQKSAAFCRMGGVRPPTLNAFSRMDAMLTDFIQAIPSSSAPPAIVDFSIQVGAHTPAASAVEQHLAAATPERAPTMYLSSAPSSSGTLPEYPSKKKKKQEKKKKRKSYSDSDSDSDFY